MSSGTLKNNNCYEICNLGNHNIKFCCAIGCLYKNNHCSYVLTHSAPTALATNHFTQGTGVFTSQGGSLTNLTSEVEIEVPKGAVAPGKVQKLWFEVIQKVYDPLEENKGVYLQSLSPDELSDSNSSVEEMESFFHERRKRVIQLSTMVLVGPSDAKFEQPIKIKMPHCLPYRNNSWHLHLQARAQNCESDDWMELSNSSGLIIPPSRQKQRFFKVSNSSE